jgi:iron complex transport system substrate-binding protein
MRKAALLLTLVACAGFLAQAAEFPVTVVDDRGQEIAIPAAPARVVVAGTPLYSEILVALGQVEKIVGVADSPENPPEVAHVPKVGTVWQPSLEAILALEPDLVLGADPLLRDRLEALGVMVVCGPPRSPGMWITDIAGVFEMIELVGRTMGVAEKAQLLFGTIAREIIAIEAQVLGRERPTAAVLYLYDPAGVPYVAGRGTPEDELIVRAGGQNAFADLSGYLQASAEAVLARDPDVIFVGTGQRENLCGHVVLAALSAVREGEVFEITASKATSTRVPEVLEAMARALHPEAFD